MDSSAYIRTRLALHAIAEQLLAGPQFRASGTIRLKPSESGFATIGEPRIAVRGGQLLVDGLPVGNLDGATISGLAKAAGFTPGAPEGVYPQATVITPDEILRIDPTHAATLARAFEMGNHALKELAPDQTPALWPEHFDLAIVVDEVNYGVSPGDSSIPEPYAYVGPWTPRTGPFWNQSFGAARPLTELSTAAAVLDFFTEGMRLASQEK
ncbi:hypothetical protein AB0N05_07555 [Nocardia sp. NPDC051030]|uniref:hypothetical protein n=1 Tax=Nocardia sp. NPDC051030 TaxID=3155162 RepID=UPI0034123F63